MAAGVRGLERWARVATVNLARTVAEYAMHENPQVASAQIAAKSINRPTNATSACSGPDGSRPENSRERPDQVTMLVAPTGKQSRNEKTLLMQ